MKPLTEYAKLYDGVQHWCRDCARNYQKQRKLENENAEESKSHLYVMSYEGRPPGIYKVGQSANSRVRPKIVRSGALAGQIVVRLLALAEVAAQRLSG